MSLVELKGKCIQCRKCPIGGRLIDGCVSNVFSNMNEDASIMVVGQNPGLDEVRQEEPFVGLSGQYFEEMLEKVVGIGRKDLYITNCVHCNTPSNRRPTYTECDNCREFLDAEIKIVKPKLVVTLGDLAFSQMTGQTGIGKHHGDPKVSIRYGVRVLPLYHPSPLNINSDDMRDSFENDLRVLRSILDERVEQEEKECLWCQTAFIDDGSFCSQECKTEHTNFMRDTSDVGSGDSRRNKKGSRKDSGIRNTTNGRKSRKIRRKN